MSLFYNNNAGVLLPVSGLNGQSGELVVGTSVTKSGVWDRTTDGGNVAAGYDVVPQTTYYKDVVFDTPMPDADYIVELQGYTGNGDEFVMTKTGSKAATGFRIYVANVDNEETHQLYYVYWKAFKLYTASDITQAQSDIATLQGKVDVEPAMTTVEPFRVIKNSFCATISTKDGSLITDKPLTAGTWSTTVRNVGTIGTKKPFDYIATHVSFQSGGTWIDGTARIYYNGRIDLWANTTLSSYIPYLSATLPLFD